jgi:hypothetical protein
MSIPEDNLGKSEEQERNMKERIRINKISK